MVEKEEPKTNLLLFLHNHFTFLKRIWQPQNRWYLLAAALFLLVNRIEIENYFQWQLGLVMQLSQA